MRYRKLPVEIDAILWTGHNVGAVLDFVGEDDRWKTGVDDGYVDGPGIGHVPALGQLDIPTLEGVMTAQAGDWIIRGVKGEIYPCKPDIFAAIYEAIAPTENAIEAGARALALGSDHPSKTEYAKARNVLEAALPAFLAAGWLPPKALEQVGTVLDDGDEVHDFRYSSPDDRHYAAILRGREPVYRLAAGWTPPEGEKTL